MTFPAPPRIGFSMIPIAAGIVVASSYAVGFVGGLLGRAISFFAPRLRAG